MSRACPRVDIYTYESWVHFLDFSYYILVCFYRLFDLGFAGQLVAGQIVSDVATFKRWRGLVGGLLPRLQTPPSSFICSSRVYFRPVVKTHGPWTISLNAS